MKNENSIAKEQLEQLIREAAFAKQMSYAPYSGFHVGAALLTEGGRIVRGCNIENGAFTPTVCAERTAIFKAVSEGERSFLAIAIVADRPFTTPCGVCLQVLSEFCDGDFPVILAKEPSKTEESVIEYRILPLKELLPHGFLFQMKSRPMK